MAAMINRDPFARQELHREAVRWPNTKCGWCGGIRTARGGVPMLYRYRTETDGGRRHEHSGLFCSKDCHDAYHA